MCLDKPNPISFTKYLNTLNDVYNNIDDYNPKSTDISTNKKYQAIANDLFIRCIKLKYLLYLSQILFSCFERSQIKFYTLSNNENL